jgi:predicted dehydrogenase
MEMVKIGLFGCGHLGKIHLRLALSNPSMKVAGIYDTNAEVLDACAKEFGVQTYTDPIQLMEDSDAVLIVTPTLTHYKIAADAIKRGKHAFIEKPVTESVKEAKSLLALAHEANVIVQVGHVERFNPAFLSAREYCLNPMFIEGHRLAQFNPRGTDVSVVLDLMIHDIDIVLSLVKSSIRRISASGVAIISNSPDITNARIEFDNGCVANLTASRISMKNMRKIRVFGPEAYISMDFLEKNSSIIRILPVIDESDPLAVIIDPGAGKPKRQIIMESPQPLEINSIGLEHESFCRAILKGENPAVSLEDGLSALEVAYKIIEKIELTSDFPPLPTIS